MRIKAKYLYYWKATDDENRDVPIYIKANGTIYVEGYQTEFNIQDIKKMQYDFDEDEEFAYITLYFGENTDICFSSEYFDDNLYLAINGTFFAGRSETFQHWETLE